MAHVVPTALAYRSIITSSARANAWSCSFVRGGW